MKDPLAPLQDMEANVLPPDTAIDIVYVQSIPGISDQPYGTSSS